MAISSINSNLAALLAQSNISNATTNTSNYVAALSSGNRIVTASTDVAALATGTSLQSQVNILTTSLTVASQGSSLLQVADGALAQISSILQRQQAIATQAQSGSLSSTQLGFLDQEFQNLTASLDQLAESTNFNGVKLLNGALSQSLKTAISGNAASTAAGSYTVTTNFANDDTLTIGGQAITFKSSATAGAVTIGNSIGASVSNVVAFINGAASNSSLSAAQKAAFSQVVATQVGTSGTFTLSARNGGSLGSTFTLGDVGGTGTGVVVKSGQYADSSSTISGIAVANTSTALTSATTGGFLSGGTLKFNGSVVAGSTISNTTSLDSLVANINANTSTSGVHASITGTAGNYSLTLIANNSSNNVGLDVTSSALALSRTTALATTGNGVTTFGTFSGGAQSITFHGLTSATTALTEGNSSLKSGAFNWTSANVPTVTQLGTVTLGTTTLQALSAQIGAVSGYTSTVTQSGSNFVLTVTQGTAGTSSGFDSNAFTGALANYATHTASNTYGLGAKTVSTITNINVVNTTTALTTASNTGTFFHGGSLTVNGAVVTGSTISSTTTLASLVSSINTNTTTSGVRAELTGETGNYTLTLITTNAASTAGLATTSTALALEATTALAANNSALNLGTYSGGTQVFTFAGLASGSTVLTEGNSSLKAGALLWDIGASNETLGTVTLGTTTLSALATAIAASNGGSAYTASVGGSSGAVTLTVTKTTPGSSTGFSSDTFSGALANYATRTSNGDYALGINATQSTVQTTSALTGGADNGIGVNSTVGTGTILDNIIVGQNQQKSQVTITYPNIAGTDLNSTDYFGAATPAAITVGGVAFTFTSTASDSATEVLIGSSLQETLDNAVAKINSFVGTGAQNFQFNQIDASRSGNSLIISTRNVGSALDMSGTTVAVTATGAGVATAGSLANGSTSGIDTSGVNNDAFVGNVTGFSASYTGTANTVNLSLTVGGITYSASNVSTNPTSNTKVQLVSTDADGKGGYLTIQLQALEGNTVNSQGDATSFAARLDTAISGLTFYQTRQVTSYDPSVNGSSIIANGSPIGSLNGSSISFTSDGFEQISIKSVSVDSPQGSSTTGSISFDINGETYSADSSIGSKLNANTTYKLVNSSDPNKYVLFTTGSTSIDFSTQANAAALESALGKAFGSGGAALTFQVGSSTADVIGVSLGSAQSSTLFSGQSLNVLTQASAAIAADVLEDAVNLVTALRATVGALEERFNYSSNAIQNAVQNQGAARSTLLDTDVASASTAFATSQVQLQAGISVLAQANQLQQNLLKLIS